MILLKGVWLQMTIGEYVLTSAGGARGIRCACTGEVESGRDNLITLVWERAGFAHAATQKVRIFIHDTL